MFGLGDLFRVSKHKTLKMHLIDRFFVAVFLNMVGIL